MWGTERLAIHQTREKGRSQGQGNKLTRTEASPRVGPPSKLSSPESCPWEGCHRLPCRPSLCCPLRGEGRAERAGGIQRRHGKRHGGSQTGYLQMESRSWGYTAYLAFPAHGRRIMGQAENRRFQCTSFSEVKHFRALRNQTFILSAIFQLRNVQTRHLHLIFQPHPLVHLQP